VSRLSNVRLVRQEDPNGCIVACLAMVTGKSYAEIRRMYPSVAEPHGGLTLFDFTNFFTLHGFAFQLIHAWDRAIDGKHTDWPFRPWADAHLCGVDAGRGGSSSHGVILLRDGTVLDPAHGERRWSDYPSVGYMCALYDVGTRPVA
jgi:hypothetical protein